MLKYDLGKANKDRIDRQKDETDTSWRGRLRNGRERENLKVFKEFGFFKSIEKIKVKQKQLLNWRAKRANL